MKLKKWLLFLMLPLLFLLDLKLFTATAQADALKNAITDIKIWDHSNGREATKVNGAYNLVQGGNYRYELVFDLSAYDNKLKDGDTFTFTVPNGATIADGTTFTLTDNETQVQLGAAKMTSNGSGKGGLITVTIQNLADYKSKTTASGVRGSFFFDFQATTVGADQDWNYKPEETQGAMSHKVTINERKQNSFSTAGENYAKIGGVIAKKPYNSAILGKSGDYSHNWTVRINTQQKTYNSPIVIKDVIPDSSAPMQFVPEQLVLRQGEYTQSLSSIANSVILKEGQDYTVAYNDTYTEFTLTINNPGNRAFMLNYMTTSPADGSLVSNTAEMEVDNTKLPFRDDRPGQTSSTVERSSRITEGGVITADISNSLVLYKQDSKTGKMLEGAVFKVTTPSGQEITLPPTDANGRVSTQPFSSEEIKKGQFTVEEVTAPEGYVLDSNPMKVTIKADGAVKTVKNTVDPNASKKLTVKKIWKDESNQDGKRPASIAVDVYANGQKLADKTVTVTGGSTDAEWTAQTTDLPIFDASGQKITYTIGEDQLDGYDAPEVDQGNLTVTNSRTPEKISIKASKKWDDAENQDGKRPANVVVKLYKEVGGQKSEVANRTLTEADQWATEFTNLNKYEKGQEVVYSLEEDAVPHYQSQVTGNAADGFVVTNTYKPETIKISGQKKWEDADNQDGKRPNAVRVKILKGQDIVDVQEVTAANGWKYESNPLPKYAAGQEIAYTVAEEAVPGYTSKVDGYNITNSYTPETVKVSGQKKWEDEDNQDGKRPASVKVKILNGDTVVDEQNVTSANEWKYESKALPKYAAGQEITYTVSEEAVPGYTSKVDGYNITNSYTPETTTVSGSKTWEDGDNQDGKRPASITVNLLADGQKVNTQTVSEAEGWSYNFTGLPVYKDGQRITYTVTEEAVPGYSTNLNGYNITNSYTPEKTEITASKTWNDSDNQDGKRPTKISIKLMKTVGGVKTEVASKEVTAADQWQTKFENLPVYENGQKIDYSIEEDDVAGYTKEIKDFTVTNSYTPEMIKISGQKVWDDANNQDGKRPASVKVKVKNGDTVVDELEVTAANDWKFESKALPKYAAGQEIAYTVTEEAVADYQTKIDKFTITNSYTPQSTEYAVTKVWDDADNQDGKRPASITVQLYRSVNGEEPVAVAGKTLTLTANNEVAADTWKASFTNLPQFDKGQEITYSVKEDDATVAALKEKGYSPKVEGQTITNSHTPEQVKVSGQKVWDDADDQDGKRPTSITVKVMDGSTIVDTLEVTAANGWKFESKDLPKYRNGQEIVYTLKEDAVAQYETKIDKFTITNSYTPETVKVSGKKVWDDANNQDGKRPASIKVKILDGDKVVDELEVTAATDWKFESKDLPKNKKGKKINYTVLEEVTVEGYSSSQEQGTDGSFTLTNSYKPTQIAVKGTAVWSDAENQDKVRPSKITVRLLADGKPIKEEVVSGENGWQYDFSGLPKYKDGKEIVYSIAADPVDGYKLEINGTQLTFSHIPNKKVTVEGAVNNKPGGQAPKVGGKALPRTGQEESLLVTILGFLTALLAGGMLMAKAKRS
ncbi:Cna B-type domain-containing protein [Streptococcus sanguinis]|uniref:Cna B-type domain-containing protein n=1 Tax=Streptococcus sanguinis TaxID=1305 RepID=UPI001CC01271|nr:Cna B-type domain-containing protein [Streptococcus sanguinis]MBZ2023794.1 Cna B-type domain-containing protein [Streptococcus sanguinis]MBZ2048625.1 Cna B-type domain-containing protein [Streptococcus sanguinis]MBZ2050990.1 Cna B-type domain-containing protein [Streptococcus sanguinis]MBZ2060061.1 Cna B-type domain-containing protein [Streptococcus sanguinis]MCC3177749.1 LPXTG cell wall anchor domain protein [Streptococcus sanguinis]